MKTSSYKFLFLILFILILFPLVSAVSPHQQGADVFSEGYDIEFTGIEVYKNGQDIDFTNHVFNISNGLELNNESVLCTFDLYDNQGMHLLDEIVMDWNPVGHDFEFVVTGGNFTRNGEYCHLVRCNSTFFGGFEETCFMITPTGDNEGLFGFFIIVYLILGGIVMFGFAVRSEWVAILGGLGLIFFGVFILNTGITIFRNDATLVISLVTIALGSIISILTGMELIENNV